MSGQESKRTAVLNTEVGGAYRVLSIDSSLPPPGCEGVDWYRYRIALGQSVITGYRRGTLHAVRSGVDEVVQGLNVRRLVAPNKMPPPLLLG